MIHLDNITVAKGGRTLFRDFSFHVAADEHWVIQGRNGSGKTTLLQLLAGTLSPISGKISHSFIQGHNWDTLYVERQNKIHFVPTHWLQMVLASSDNVFYQQRYYSIGDERLPKVSDIIGGDANALMDLRFPGNFDISKLLNLPVTRLSNGQLKKVMILRQLAKNMPRVLILDYPFDGLDAESRADLSDFISSIAKQFGIQVILSDHGENLPSVINRRLVLDNFQISEISAPQHPVAPDAVNATAISDNSGSHEDPIVELQDVTIEYGGKRIISGLNWRIRRGERWALTGRNGSGKTTLFSLIYADHPMAYSQKVYLFGKRRGTGESIWEIKRRINYFGPEHIHFFDQRLKSLTGREFINSQSHKGVNRLTDLIEFFDADGYIDLAIRQLSSGQLQMVLLMNMFLDNKELLLLDEPFQFLDPVNHERVTSYLNHYLDGNTTLILITHYEKDVARWTQHRMRL